MEAIRELLRARRSFVIMGHTSPDGDAVGACFGLGLILAALGKEVLVLLEPYDSRFSLIPGKELLYTGAAEALTPEVCVAVDCGDVQRLGAAKAVFDRAAVTVCIDHHGTNTGFAQYNYIEPGAASASELVYALAEPLCEIRADAAAALYAGMVLDTGGFRHSMVRPSTMEIAGRLIARGIPFSEIYNGLLHTRSLASAKIMGRALDAAAVCGGGRLIYTCVTRAMLREAGADKSDLDGIVGYLITISGVEAAVLLYERDDPSEIKVSLRSKGIGVDAVAQGLGGGGHKQAAGATVKGGLRDVARQVIAALEEVLPRG